MLTKNCFATMYRLRIDSGSKWQASKSSTHSMMMWSLTIPFTRRSRVDVTYGGPKFLVPPQILWMSQFSFFFLLAETSVLRRKRQKLKYWKNKNQTRKYFQSDIDNSYQVESYSSLRKFFTKEEFILMHPI